MRAIMLPVRLERVSLRLQAEHRARRLDAVLGAWLPPAIGRPLSKSVLRRLVMAGAILLDGRAVRRPGQTLRPGQLLEARIDLGRLPPSERGEGATDSAASASSALTVLFEDDWLIAVAKPAGLQVHVSADRTRPDLFTMLRDHVAGREVSPPAGEKRAYLALHHRLDVGTSGVVLFATDPAANAGLSRAFAGHHVEKVYEAITRRPQKAIDGRWVARGPLAPVGTGRGARVRVVAGGQPAETAFLVVRRFPAAWLVEARPATGRKHQVRAHLAEAGAPILGDARYGGPLSAAGARVPRVMLHAAALRLAHPVTGEPLDIRCPRPADFQRLLDLLDRPVRSLDRPRASR